MRLYTTTGATQVDDPEFGTFTADANGAFDGLPDAMYAKLHGRPGWENDAERERRVTTEELEKYRDPAELLKAVKSLGESQGVLATAVAAALGLVKAPAQAEPAPQLPVAPSLAGDAPAPVAAPEVPDIATGSGMEVLTPPAPENAATPAPAKPGRRGRAAAAGGAASSA